MVVDGEPVGAFARYNKEGDFLTIRPGGKRVPVTLPDEALDVAVRAAKATGLSVAGIDLLEHEGVFYRIEANMSPQFRVFEKVTGVNVAEKIVDCVLRQYNE
jgi:ribosomal protein S6--L-glutamate ligase